MGSTPVVMLGSSDICKQFYSSHMTDRPRSLNLGNYFERWIGKCLGCLVGKEWGKTKAAFRDLFQINDDKRKLFERILDQWHNQQTNLCYTQQPVLDLVRYVPLQFILKMIFGETWVDQHAEQFISLNGDAMYIMKQVFNNFWSRFYIYQFIPTQANETLSRFRTNWGEMVTNCLKNNSSNCSVKTIWDHCKRRSIPFDVFCQTLAEVVYANQDVTVPSFAWLVTHLTMNKFHLNDNEDLINRFIEESARISPIFPFSMQQISTVDKTVSNGSTSFYIPKGTYVCLDFFSLGLNENDWKQSDLNVFNYDRFDEILSDRNQKTWSISRFGLGARRCPGQYLSNFMMSNFLQFLCNNYEFIQTSNKLRKKNHYCNNIPIRDDTAFLAPNIKVLARPKPLYFHLNRDIMNDENVYVGISVNDKSVFIKDKSCVDNLIRFLSTLQGKSMIVIVDDITKTKKVVFGYWSLVHWYIGTLIYSHSKIICSI